MTPRVTVRITLCMVRTCVPRLPSGSLSVGIGGGAVDTGGEAAEKSIKGYIKLVYWQSILQGWLSGSDLGVIIGSGEGVVDEGMGATRKKFIRRICACE